MPPVVANASAGGAISNLTANACRRASLSCIRPQAPLGLGTGRHGAKEETIARRKTCGLAEGSEQIFKSSSGDQVEAGPRSWSRSNQRVVRCCACTASGTQPPTWAMNSRRFLDPREVAGARWVWSVLWAHTKCCIAMRPRLRGLLRVLMCQNARACRKRRMTFFSSTNFVASDGKRTWKLPRRQNEDSPPSTPFRSFHLARVI
jgi:hypothetical protein